MPHTIQVCLKIFDTLPQINQFMAPCMISGITLSLKEVEAYPQVRHTFSYSDQCWNTITYAQLTRFNWEGVIIILFKMPILKWFKGRRKSIKENRHSWKGMTYLSYLLYILLSSFKWNMPQYDEDPTLVKVLSSSFPQAKVEVVSNIFWSTQFAEISPLSFLIMINSTSVMKSIRRKSYSKKGVRLNLIHHSVSKYD